MDGGTIIFSKKTKNLAYVRKKQYLCSAIARKGQEKHGA